MRRLLGAAAAALLLWLGGLAWFVTASLSAGGDRSVATDAIVVLTGGRLRLETGLDLLGAGKAQKLFISGVNPRVDRVELLRVVTSLRDFDTGRVILGHAADNTLGNARETAAWMRREGYRSLRLVTSWHHMRRSVLEFERTMPEILILAEPVFAGRAEPGLAGWVDVALLAIEEYDKFLLTRVWPGISEVWPAAPARPAAAAEPMRAAA
jgi:uncharacterized SAM-binding protein YcdF (DUF218 family)